MGLFNKLLDGLGVDSEAAKKVVDSLIDSAKEQNRQREERAAYAESIPASGDSWGEEMPSEENQYNYNGTYIQYFENIFRTDFPELTFEKQELPGTRRSVYTFYSGASKALILELMNEASSAGKIRYDAGRENIPYVRFYYDHEGWWNTRSYVTRRIREALR